MSERIALKIDVDTLRGTLEGVPALAQLLQCHRVGATFLFSLGPDHTGRALRRIFRAGFVRKVLRTSVSANYGWKTLCYGTLLPGPDISARGREVMRSVREMGFEVGVHCYDHVLWQDNVATQSYEWTRQQMQLAIDAFEYVFGDHPIVHGAAGWQVNEHVLNLEAELGFKYASDTRGREAFRPTLADGRSACPQLPTTLPTFDELIGLGGCTEDNVVDVLLEYQREPARSGHVYTLHAEIEGMRLLPAFERLLKHWLDRGTLPCSLGAMYAALPMPLPSHSVESGAVPGRSGQLACQGAPTNALRIGLDD